jgi:hypothetical protein
MMIRKAEGKPTSLIFDAIFRELPSFATPCATSSDRPPAAVRSNSPRVPYTTSHLLPGPIEAIDLSTLRVIGLVAPKSSKALCSPTLPNLG